MLKKILYVFLISIVPIVELRAAIPVGAGLGIPAYWCFLAAILGNMLPVPFILLFIPAVLRFMEKHRIFPRLVAWVQRKGQRGVEKLQAKQKIDLAGDPPSPDASLASEDGEVPEESAQPDAEKKREIRKQRGVTIGVLMGLFAFVAVPLPGTGAWTGSLIAALFGMKKRYAIPVIFAGVLVAGLVMTLASYGIVAALNFFVS